MHRKHDQHLIHSQTQDVLKSVKNVVNSLLNNQSDPTQLIPSVESSLNKTILQVEETTNSSILGEVFGNKTVELTETMANNSKILGEMPSNTTILTEILESNRTISNSNLSTVTETESNTISGMVKTTISSTENVVTTIKETFTSIGNAQNNEDNTSSHSKHQLDNIEDNTLYIVVGVILGMLILTGIILLIIYKRYKQRGFGASSGVYRVNEYNQVRVSIPKETESSMNEANIKK